jgi:mycothiol synthase
VVEIRTPDKDDAGAVAEVLNAHAAELYAENVIGTTEVAYWFGLPSVHFWLAEGPGGELAAYADVREGGERTRYWLDLREHPERRELGGAAALLRAAEGWARGRAAPGALLRGEAAAPDEPARRLYEEAEYLLVRHSLEMRAELDVEPPEPRWPNAITVRTFADGDEVRVYEADMEAFEDHWEFVREPFAEWRARLVEHPRFDPSLWFLAEEGSDLAGFCLARMHGSEDATLGYVSVLGVRRPWRRRGLGLGLLRHAFREFRARGMTRARLDVDGENLTGAVRLYERAGMSIVKQRDTYEKTL